MDKLNIDRIKRRIDNITVGNALLDNLSTNVNFIEFKLLSSPLMIAILGGGPSFSNEVIIEFSIAMLLSIRDQYPEKFYKVLHHLPDEIVKPYNEYINSDFTEIVEYFN